MGNATLESLGFSITLGDWKTLSAPASQVRLEVFVHEQKVPLEEELDQLDEVCTHAVVFDKEGLPVATGRLLPDGHIGRMAVLQRARGYGVGGMVLQHLIDLAQKKGFKEVILSAQLQAMGFYARYGFVAEGEVYLDANIEHKTMRLVF